MKYIFILLFISSVAAGQDSLHKAQIKNDSLLISSVMIDMRATLYGKVAPAYYDLLTDFIKEYLRQKQLFWADKPKKK